MKTLLTIDGNSLMNRAFYGVQMLNNANGVPTGAIFGFLNMYFRLLEEHRPDYVCVCFDVHAPTFRHKMYDGYKAQRRPMPDELKAQMPLIKEILDKMGVPRLEKEGFEADDLLGTLARECREDGICCVIVTGDKDSLQFIDQGAYVALITTQKGVTSTTVYNKAVFAEKYCGLEPIRIIDLKALMGDSSDNIPGVFGIGEKGALNLLCEFGTLDGVYQSLDSPKITASVRRKLTEGRESAYLSFRLATGCLNAPVDKRPAELAPTGGDRDGLYRLLSELELRTFIKKLGLTPPEDAKKDAFRAPETVICGSFAEAEKAFSRLSDRVTVLTDTALRAFAVCDGTVSAVFTEMQTDISAEKLMPLLSGRKISMHDGKSFASALLKRGGDLPEIAFDTALAAYIADAGTGKYDIASLAEKYLGETARRPIYDDEDAFDLFGGGDEALAALAFNCALDFAVEDALKKELENKEQLSLLYDMELPLAMVLAEMEHTGIRIDKKRLADYGETLDGDIKRIEGEIYALADETFNISSPKQLSDVLFEKLGLRHGKKSKTGSYSTDADTLLKLKNDHPVIEKILDYRKLTKLKSTYVEGLVRVADEKGLIHSTFHQTVTTTGRLSSTEPNLQNLPVRRGEGAEIRRFFVPAEGNIFVDADYSQIELRILAHIAQDANMIRAFREDADIHTVTASQVFGVPPELVTEVMRSRAKAVNFGIVYGISAFSLAEDIGVSVAEAQGYISTYLDKYDGIREYMERIKKQAEAQGYVSTIYGRRRYLPELKSENRNVRSFGQRAALNAPMQGTAADIIKIAMIRVAGRLRKEGLAGKLILQIHDELLVECPAAEKEAVERILREEMENAASLSVSLKADIGFGENFYDAKG